MAKRSGRTTLRQFDIMVDFITDHKEMVQLQNKTGLAFSSEVKVKLWEELQELLNNHVGMGPKKTVAKWKRTWIDLKSDVKMKTKEIAKQKVTGGGEPIQPMSPLYLKVASLIEKISVEGNPYAIEPGREPQSVVVKEESQEEFEELTVLDDDDEDFDVIEAGSIFETTIKEERQEELEQYILQDNGGNSDVTEPRRILEAVVKAERQEEIVQPTVQDATVQDVTVQDATVQDATVQGDAMEESVSAFAETSGFATFSDYLMPTTTSHIRDRSQKPSNSRRLHRRQNTADELLLRLVAAEERKADALTSLAATEVKKVAVLQNIATAIQQGTKALQTHREHRG